MHYDILYTCEAENGVKCFVCKAILENYISSLKPDFFEFDIQRGIVRNTYLNSLRDTILRKEVFPPISLTVSGEPSVEGSTLNVDDNNTEILDGLQRTFRLWTYKQINDRVIEHKITDYHELVNVLKSDDLGKRIIDQYFGSSGIWSDGYCEWYIDNLYALCVTICILSCSYASTHLNTIEPFVGANYSF